MQLEPRTPPTLVTLRRYGLPLVIAAAMAVVLLNGWHHHSTLETVVAQRDRFHQFLAANVLLSVLAYVALYVVLVALSLPCGTIMTIAGGLLFGWLGGALAAMVGATLGATLVFLIARSAVGD